jgi:protein YibB
MQKLPKTLVDHAKLFWPEGKPAKANQTYDGKDITVVTSFFDLGRGEWQVQGGLASPYQRKLDHYFQYFGHLAKLKNPMVVFVAPEHAQRVLDSRQAAGLVGLTTVFTISDLFAIEKVKELVAEVQSKLTPDFRNFVRFPKVPEFNEPRYTVNDSLKSIFVNTAIDAGAVPTQQVAWLDFGYARDEKCFDPAKPWRFDAGGKINMFHMRPMDNLPVFKALQRGYVYFQGGCKIGPVEAWPAFSEAIDLALVNLMSADLVDDEQTLLLMAYRANPSAYRVFPMDRRDWRVAIRFFTEERQGEDVKFRDYRLVNSMKDSVPGKVVRKLAAKAARITDKFS